MSIKTLINHTLHVGICTRRKSVRSCLTITTFTTHRSGLCGFLRSKVPLITPQFSRFFTRKSGAVCQNFPLDVCFFDRIFIFLIAGSHLVPLSKNSSTRKQLYYFKIIIYIVKCRGVISVHEITVIRKKLMSYAVVILVN